jgi:catechol 2,3-dioxygenase-like lactoylglutathione lyase family enzyme
MTKMHLSLRVRNLKDSVAFYQAFFGVSPHKVRPGYANFDLADPPLKLALNESRVEEGTGALDHLGFLVSTAQEVYAAKERLQTAGLATFDETDVTCCYAKQDKIWVHDPDGNEWEVYVLTEDLLDDWAGTAPTDAAMPLRTWRRALPITSPVGAPCCPEREAPGKP